MRSLRRAHLRRRGLGDADRAAGRTVDPPRSVHAMTTFGRLVVLFRGRGVDGILGDPWVLVGTPREKFDDTWTLSR
jgi:hypothetical protein